MHLGGATVATTTIPDLRVSPDAREQETIERLHDKLAHELIQAEHDACLQSRREAKRQGPGKPAEILLEIADHAEQTEARLRALVGQPISAALALIVAQAFTNVRYYAFDRMLSHERTYRATLLGLRHGLDAAHLLHAAAKRGFRPQTTNLCGELIRLREPMLAKAVDAVTWFADHPAFALK